jgi:hypothetical protein
LRIIAIDTILADSNKDFATAIDVRADADKAFATVCPLKKKVHPRGRRGPKVWVVYDNDLLQSGERSFGAERSENRQSKFTSHGPSSA